MIRQIRVSTWIRKHIPKISRDKKSKTDYNLSFIADYSNSRRLSFSEVEQAVRHQTDRVENFNCVPVRPFNTIEAGFVLRQLAVDCPKPENKFFYVNVAPRKDETSPRVNNDGEDLVYLELENGVEVVSTLSGYTLSFVRDEIKDLKSLNVSSKGSQFRSRDIFPEAVAKVMENEQGIFEGEVEAVIPSLPENRVGYIDGFGNIKTTIRKSEIDKQKEEVFEVEINAQAGVLTFSDGIFHVSEGEMVFAPGSSGGEDPFMEIVLRGGSAAERLGNTKPGDRIEIDI